MRHLGTKMLETQRLCLCRFELSDAPAMYHNWASDPEVTKYLTWPTHASVDISAMIVADWISRYSEENYYQWAIVLKELDQPIGSIAVVHMNEEAQKVEIGYCIGKNWWHQGIVSEALEAVIHFFFREVQVNRVEACHDTNNPNSGKVMAKCGMTFEGVHRQAGMNNQGLCDLSYYGILRKEWRSGT